MAIFSDDVVFFELQTTLSSSIEASDDTFLGRFVVDCGRVQNFIVYVFCLLPLSVSEMLTGLTLGHCTAEVVPVAVVRSHSCCCRTGDDGSDHGVGNVYRPALSVLHSSEELPDDC